ncbi:hypothetical protein WMY93_023552 [Mugilogobius chulae]|uniref:Uncharacterized protein n=1 Tax=Mugilogobius chulae TaxID=88201 RepID=A0AAW0NBK9_9GOBI
MNTEVEQDGTRMGDTAPDCPIEEGSENRTGGRTALEKLSQCQADVASREEEKQKFFQRIVKQDKDLCELSCRNTNLFQKLKLTKAELEKKDKINQELELKLKETAKQVSISQEANEIQTQESEDERQDDSLMQVITSTGEQINSLKDLLEELEEDFEVSKRRNRYLQGELRESNKVTTKLREYLAFTKQDLKQERLKSHGGCEEIRRLKETIAELEQKVKNQEEHKASLCQKVESVEIELKEEKQQRLKLKQELDAKEEAQKEILGLQQRLVEVTEERDQFERSKNESWIKRWSRRS